MPRETYRAYIKDLNSRYFYEKEGMYADLARYAHTLELIADGTADDPRYAHCEYRREAEELRVKLVEPMGW